MQYIFDPAHPAIDFLVEHVYQRSVAEVLIRLMSLGESNFNETLATAIQKRKISVITKLVNKLDNETEDEAEDECQNAAQVLTELLQQSDLFSVIARKPTMQRLCELSFNDEKALMHSRIASKTVLEKLIQKINNNKGVNKSIQDSEDDDLIIKQDSDEEEAE